MNANEREWIAAQADSIVSTIFAPPCIEALAFIAFIRGSTKCRDPQMNANEREWIEQAASIRFDNVRAALHRCVGVYLRSFADQTSKGPKHWRSFADHPNKPGPHQCGPVEGGGSGVGG